MLSLLQVTINIKSKSTSMSGNLSFKLLIKLTENYYFNESGLKYKTYYYAK